MSNLIVHWWRRYKLKQALKRGDRQKAKILLQQNLREKRGLTWWESLFYNQLKQEKSYQTLLDRQLLLEQKNTDSGKDYLTPDLTVINQFSQRLQITQHDPYKRQITGIDGAVFDEFESQLADYLEEEFTKQPTTKIKSQLKEALDDLNSLKQGRDPSYGMTFTPHIYFMKYFLENTYSLYLAWLFIYEQGLLSAELKILDIAASPATTAYGLTLFLKSLEKLQDIPQTHISYFSLEQQKNFQYRGLQFWRKYSESQNNPINAYFRFFTEDIFEYSNWSNKVPHDFFDMIFISHCFSSDLKTRKKFSSAYKTIIEMHLCSGGLVVLLIQDKKLFQMYKTAPCEDPNKERQLILDFVQEFNLQLVNYQYLTSAPSKDMIFSKDFGKFANENLPKIQWIYPLLKEYLGQKFQPHYTLDDYVILARR